MGGPEMDPFWDPFWTRFCQKGGPFLGPEKIQSGPGKSNNANNDFLAGAGPRLKTFSAFNVGE